jgi:hypothetical protein
MSGPRIEFGDLGGHSTNIDGIEIALPRFSVTGSQSVKIVG